MRLHHSSPLFRKLAWLFAAAIFALIASVVVCNLWVLSQSRDRIITELSRLPHNDVGLVLGASPILGGQFRNPFFEGRMNAAAFLYHNGSVRHLLVTGDNGTADYDEPSAMRTALISRGVPESAITLDYAGFRTLDSVVRAKAIFGLEHATIITDDFHQPRALFLAQFYGLDAVGYPSEHVPFAWSKRTRIREFASRMKACIDVYLLKKQPHYLGQHEQIKFVQQ